MILPRLTVAEVAFLRRLSGDGAALVGEDAELAGSLVEAGMIRTLAADGREDAYAVLSGAGIRRLRFRP